MQNERIDIVQLQPECWDVLKDLKLRSVVEEPIAFADFDTIMATYTLRPDEEWVNWLKKENRVGVYAKSGNEIVGMVSAVMHESVADIQHMYVQVDSRGQGIGKKLLDDLLSRLKEKGVELATLEVLESQKEAINLYKSLGFHKTAAIQVTRGSELVPAFAMEKPL